MLISIFGGENKAATLILDVVCFLLRLLCFRRAKKNYSAADCVSQKKQNKNNNKKRKQFFSGRTGSQITHANVAINSSYAARVTQRPSAERRAHAEFRCGARRGGKRAICS